MRRVWKHGCSSAWAFALPTSTLTACKGTASLLLCQGVPLEALGPLAYWMCFIWNRPTGVWFVVAGGLTQDLTLILSTKKHQAKQNKQRKQNPRKNSSTTKEVERDSLWRIYAVHYCQQQHPWKCQSWRRHAVCYYRWASWWASRWRYAVFYCQPHCEELLVHLLCTFIKVFIKNYASSAKSRAGKVCISGTCYQ